MYIACYLLCQLTKDKPEKQDIIKVLDSMSLYIEEEILDNLFVCLENKSVYDLIVEGKKKLQSADNTIMIETAKKNHTDTLLHPNIMAHWSI